MHGILQICWFGMLRQMGQATVDTLAYIVLLGCLILEERGFSSPWRHCEMQYILTSILECWSRLDSVGLCLAGGEFAS